MNWTEWLSPLNPEGRDAKTLAEVEMVMTRIPGDRGNLVKFGLGAKSWLLSQIEDDNDALAWMPPEGGRSASEIVDHVTLVVSVVATAVADEMGIRLGEQTRIDDTDDRYERVKMELDEAYNLFVALVSRLKEDDLHKTVALPPPSRVREGTVERVLRIMMGYHTVHHAGQVAMTLRRAKEDLAGE
ncbi:DinB family protein [Candidatus Thorarchaeota archaeon]|nr:MAG: DinB family protein [Candidatus Thorarchaeota archaeon]